MQYSLLADLILITHFAFILFALFGALLVIKYRWLAWLQIPAFIWAAAVNVTNSVCPLTPLEIGLRVQAGETAYEGSFIQHYLMPIIYPGPMSREIIIGGAIVVVLWNVVIYAWIIYRSRKTCKS
jgi:hypothetical protein